LQQDQYSDIIHLSDRPESREKLFRIIIKSYKERIYWLVRRMLIVHEDTDDVVQNTFIKVWENLSKYRGDAHIYTWIYRIAVNESLLFLKKKKKFNTTSSDHNEHLLQHLESDVYFEGDEFQLKLQKALLLLPDKQRLVFNLKYFEEMKYKEMALVLNKSEGALKANYHHAVKKIEEFINTH
jgi:RNA polymerase sigma-70 factor (ECF subfamily)